MAGWATGDGERVPAGLRTIFIDSNSGKVVNLPPSGGIASKVFQRFRGGTRRVGARTRSMLRRGDDNASVDGSAASTRRRAFRRRNSNDSVGDDSVDFIPPDKGGDTQTAATPVEHKSPQDFLNVMLRTRGYRRDTHLALQTAYNCKPNALQLSSYDSHFLELIEDEEIEILGQLLRLGVSPNGCNEHGESVLHYAARKGCRLAFRTLTDYGGSVQVSDSIGRTPLHTVCNSLEPSFRIVDMIIREDTSLFFIADVHGALPLSYVPREIWGIWTDFLYKNRDKYWPARNVRLDGVQEQPPMALLPVGGKPLPAPYRPLEPRLAAMLASGIVSPDDVAILENGVGDTDSETQSIDSLSSSEFDSLSIDGDDFGGDVVPGLCKDLPELCDPSHRVEIIM